MFKIGQKVRFDLDGQKIVAFIDSKAHFGEEPLWWIKVGNGCQLIEEASLIKMDCTCGAARTYAPIEPPGHGYKCDAEI